ncbi:prostaglandin E synthase 2-like [Liolophura sinensis]|uniref:prostaglandin E synthase 2-like n=1 Tax=Liolophura sinensis TaxID=3198878 RepID=UPI00315858F6
MMTNADSKTGESSQKNGPLSIKPTKSVRVDTDNYGLKMTLFQYQTCPFCCKVRALLDYYGFSYDVVEVNSVWRTQTKWSSYKKVPILVIHGEKNKEYLQLNDSSVIMSILETYLMDTNQSIENLLKFYPSIESKNAKGKTEIEFPNKYFIMYQDMVVKSTAQVIKEERKWRSWVDNTLVHSLSPNVYRTPSEALQAFKYFSQVGDWENTFSAAERMVVIYVGAVAMYFVGKILKKRHSLKDDVRSSLYDQCKEWTAAIGNKKPFMGGDQPNLADLSVYGVLNSIEGCDAFQDVLQNTKIGPWYERMKKVVSHHGGANSSNKQR